VGEFFETEDMGLAEHLLSGVYGAVQISPHGQRRGIRLTRTSLTSAAHLDQVSFAMSLDIAAAPIGALIFNDLKSGRVRHGSDREDRSYGSGQVYLAGQPEHPRTATIQDAVAELAVIDPALVTQLADTTQGRAPRPVRFTSYGPVSPPAAAQWRVTYAYVRDTMLASPDAAAEPLVAAGAIRLLVATALAAFPNNALTDPTSPMEYLRRVRRDHARQDLMRAGPGGGLTVTAVAYRWGFRSSSRFAAAYRRAYGVSPSHTLNRD
jgi:Helix-turn-helix domain